MKRWIHRVLFRRNGRLRAIFQRLLISSLGQSALFDRFVLKGFVTEELAKDDRPVILVACHEASRTGAPVLGWNIVRRLSPHYRVIAVLLRGGELEADFRAAASATAWLGWMTPTTHNIDRAVDHLVATYRPLYAIVNSLEAGIMTPALARNGVPVVALAHEFASYVKPRSKLSATFEWAAHVVFSARMVIESAQQEWPGLADRAGIHLLPQGRCEIPTASGRLSGAASRTIQPEQLRPIGREKAFVILGAGSVNLRKGVDLFISTAAAACRLRPDLPLLFVWVGNGFDPQKDVEYSLFLDEQIKRSGIADRLVMREAVENLDALYPQADLFLLSSRLDPQPNVGIDAMSCGLPVVCFERSVGTAEVLAPHSLTRDLVVPYLDTGEAARRICELADDPERLSGLRAAVTEIAAAAFNMTSYIETLDELGRSAARHSSS